MSARIPLILLAAAIFFPFSASGGEIVKRSYTNADGKTLTGYVYKSGSSKGRTSTHSRSRLSTNRYPAYRSHGYTVARGRSYARGGYHCRPSRPTVRTTRTNITYNAACPITVGPRHRGGVTVYRRR